MIEGPPDPLAMMAAKKAYADKHPIDARSLTGDQLERIINPSLNDLPSARPLLDRLCTRLARIKNSLFRIWM